MLNIITREELNSIRYYIGCVMLGIRDTENPYEKIDLLSILINTAEQYLDTLKNESN